MHFTTLVSTVLATLPLAVFGTGSTGTVCDTIPSYHPGAFTTCTVLACLEIKPVTQRCGCSTIPTITLPRKACPTSCGSTTYITAVEDCFPTSSPSSSSHSSTPTLTSSSTSVTTTSSSKSHSSTPSSTKPPHSTSSSTSHTSSSSSSTKSSLTKSSSTKSFSSSPHTTPPVTTTPYTNTTVTKTKTETHITTLTTCPASVTCTGQTVTYTSTEVCPTTTCTCVLPTVTYTTTVLPQGQTTVTTTRSGSTPPSPITSARPTFSQASGSGGRVEAGVGALGAFVMAFLGMM